jgi:hypothetical protein
VRLKRVYHHYERLEEFMCGMWRIVTTTEKRRPYRDAAAALMRDPEAFKAAMLRAVHEWTFSCEHNLTSMASNRIAWLGHAGTCLATSAPEDITREAWWTLTPSEQDEANRVAAEALAVWERQYIAQKGGRHG